MARYIDADALLSNLPNDLPYKASVKRVLMQAHTADVAPKIEVAALKIELEAMRTAANAYKMHYEKAKSEVDKDIKVLTKEVAKRKAMLLDAIDTFRNLLCIESFVDYEDTRKHYVVNLDGVDCIHDELKKKYTEEG